VRNEITNPHLEPCRDLRYLNRRSVWVARLAIIGVNSMENIIGGTLGRLFCIFGGIPGNGESTKPFGLGASCLHLER